MMLKPSNRSLYSYMLRPPVGYKLDRAVGTTFSLDPLMALTIPLQFASFDINEGIKDGIVLYEAIRRVSDKIDIFLDKGRMLYPKNAHVLYGMLEDVLHEVTAPNGGAFHPKCWIIRYKSNEDNKLALHRFIVLSRNMTFDRSWDISLCLDQNIQIKDNNRKQNQPIKDLFLSLLSDDLPKNKIKDITNLLKGLDTVTWEYPEGIDSIEFYATGLKNKLYRLPRMPKAYGKMIISPFCSDKALLKLLGEKAWQTNVLISRNETLNKLSAETLTKFSDVYILTDEYLHEENDVDDNALSGLHAKVFIYNYNYSRTVMMLGSTNATNNALLNYKNVEFMAQIEGKSSKMGGKISDQLLGMRDVVTLYQPSKDKIIEDDSHEKLLEEIRKIIIKADFKILLNQVEEEYYNIILKSENLDISYFDKSKVYAWPITRSESLNEEIVNNEQNYIGKVTSLYLTGLIAFNIKLDKENQLKFVLNIPIINPPKERDKALIKHIIANRESFLRYIFFLLSSDDEVSSYEAMQSLRGNKNTGGYRENSLQLPLLEEMIKAFTTDRASFWHIKSVIDKLSEEYFTVIPDDFKLLWEEIEKVLEVEV